MKLTRKLMIGAALAMLTVAGASNSFANTLTIDRVSGHYSGNGGEFTITPTDSGPLNPYVADYAAVATYTYSTGTLTGLTGVQTFCIEYNEHVSIPASYHYDLGPGAIKGGNTVSDTVSVGTGYLYSQFAKGVLGGYTYTVGGGRASSAATLQEAIWWLEGELSLSPAQVAANTFLSQVASVFGSAVAGQADVAIVHSTIVTAGFYGVGAVNMGDAPTYPNQDQLYYHSVGNTLVPDGGLTLMLLGMAMTGLASVRRQLGR